MPGGSAPHDCRVNRGSRQPNRRTLAGALVAALVIVCTAALAYGAVPIAPWNIPGILWASLGLPGGHGLASDLEMLVMRDLRLPRLTLGLAAGAGLAMAGAALQGLFRNPLADPGLIGVSSGGAVGAVAAFVLAPAVAGSTAFFLSAWFLPLAACAGALLTTFLIYRIAHVRGVVSVPHLLLTGLAVNAIATAIIGALIYTASDDQLRRFTFWTLGSLHRARWAEVLPVLLAVGVACAFLLRQARPLNALLLGEAEAFHAGVDIRSVKRRIILLAAIAAGAVVSVCGMIGFIGLVAPHLIRLIAGPDHRFLLPASAVLGAILLVGADLLARALLAPSELPLGILTAIIGGPFFLWLIHRDKQRFVV